MTIQFPVYTFHFLYSSYGCSSKGLPAGEELPVNVSTTSKVTLQPTGKGKEMEAIYGAKNPKMALISEYLAADLSPDTSADALAIIDIIEIMASYSVTAEILLLIAWHEFYQLLLFYIFQCSCMAVVN